MTDAPDFAPGCYASSIFFRTDATECVSCEYRESCMATVKRNERATIKKVDAFDKLFRSSRTVGIAKWWSGRWNAKKPVQRDLSRFKAVLTQWTTEDVNPFRLQHLDNPADKSKDPPLWDTFQFMIEARAFKPRDLAEHLREIYPALTKAKSLDHAKLVCDTLLLNDILKKEKRGVYCL